jgi:16S rRNA (guanine527-N7)-methyltransferase
MERLDIYVALLAKWRKAVNLISERTFTEIWTRHIADSAQLSALALGARTWVDMGAGAGFPGMIIAMMLAGTPGARVHLIESDLRKCAFLREAARETGAPAEVHAVRIENAPSLIANPVDAVTARALAPLPQLLAFSSIWLRAGAVGVFPRGKTGGRDAEHTSDNPEYAFEFSRSRIDRESQIVRVTLRDPLSTAGLMAGGGVETG